MAAKVTGEVVSNPTGLQPFKVVLTHEGSVLCEWPVVSIQEGQAQIIRALRELDALE